MATVILYGVCCTCICDCIDTHTHTHQTHYVYMYIAAIYTLGGLQLLKLFKRTKGEPTQKPHKTNNNGKNLTQVKWTEKKKRALISSQNPEWKDKSLKPFKILAWW